MTQGGCDFIWKVCICVSENLLRCAIFTSTVNFELWFCVIGLHWNQILSSSVWLGGDRQRKAIFRSPQRSSFRLTLGLWLIYHRTLTELSLGHSCIVLAVCFRVWLYDVRALWTRFSSKICLYFALFIFFSALPLKNTPTACWFCHHHASTCWFWAGDQKRLVSPRHEA